MLILLLLREIEFVRSPETKETNEDPEGIPDTDGEPRENTGNQRTQGRPLAPNRSQRNSMGSYQTDSWGIFKPFLRALGNLLMLLETSSLGHF